MRKTEKLRPIHPGEVLKSEFLEPDNLNANKLAMATGLSATRIGEILRGRRGITAETAIAFSEFFGNSAEFWMNMQSRYDLEVAQDLMEDTIKARVAALRSKTQKSIAVSEKNLAGAVLSRKSTKQTVKPKAAAASGSRKTAQGKRA